MTRMITQMKFKKTNFSNHSLKSRKAKQVILEDQINSIMVRLRLWNVMLEWSVLINKWWEHLAIIWKSIHYFSLLQSLFQIYSLSPKSWKALRKMIETIILNRLFRKSIKVSLPMSTFLSGKRLLIYQINILTKN